ncbi:septum site-determining protein MinC [Colwellia piezophila]|uniref:septum site-determining protein MinC n=1 Tax=Colwellia piezophila TaxID=211668 RepID=UPI000372CB1C|nr:septum site-determining protein MinC [Colwellia piezophila]
MAFTSIEFKGTSFTLSVLQLKSVKLADVRADLTKKIAQAPDFFHLVPLVVSIEKINDSLDYQAVKLLVEELNFTFVGFTGTVDKAQRQLIRELGFSFINTAKALTGKALTGKALTSKANVAKNTGEKSMFTDKATVATQTPIAAPDSGAQKVSTPQVALFTDKIHRGPIRSGQQVYAKGQNLVVIGSVSAGAEVIADGNIHVYGSLRGRAIAGAQGHHQAKIYCQNLQAELVSINGNYWLSESMEEHWDSPAYINLTDSELTSSKLI